MIKHYNASMFQKYDGDTKTQYNKKPLTRYEAIECKVNLMKEFCIVTHANECEVRKFLSNFDSEYQMTVAIHDALVGNKTIEEIMKGSM